MSVISPTNFAALRESVVQAARQLVATGVLSHSQHGNISARMPGERQIVLTSTSTLSGLKPEQLPLLDLEGNVLEGELEPISAEIVPMHTAVYLEREDVGGVIHTHSPFATVFAVANKPIECCYEGLARFDMVDPVAVARYGPRGSEESVRYIREAITRTSKAVLLQNHGILAFDRDVLSAARIVVVLEEAAELAIRATAIGGATLISREDATYAQRRAAEFAARGTARAG